MLLKILYFFIFTQICYNYKKQVFGKEKHKRFYIKHLNNFIFRFNFLIKINEILEVQQKYFILCGLILTYHNFRRSRWALFLVKFTRTFSPSLYIKGMKIHGYFKNKKKNLVYFFAIIYIICTTSVFAKSSYLFFILHTWHKRCKNTIKQYIKFNK